MDENIIAHSIFILIENNFQGGLASFKKEGGFISSVPNEVITTFVIYHPDIPETFVSAVRDVNNKGEIQIMLTDTLNFNGQSMTIVLERLDDSIHSIMEKFNLMAVLANPFNPLTMIIRIPEKEFKNDEIDEIIDIINSNIEGIHLGCIIAADKVYRFSSNKVITPTIQKEPERVSITDDAITDLKILLSGDKDVMDIINNM